MGVIGKNQVGGHGRQALRKARTPLPKSNRSNHESRGLLDNNLPPRPPPGERAPENEPESFVKKIKITGSQSNPISGRNKQTKKLAGSRRNDGTVSQGHGAGQPEPSPPRFPRRRSHGRLGSQSYTVQTSERRDTTAVETAASPTRQRPLCRRLQRSSPWSTCRCWSCTRGWAARPLIRLAARRRLRSMASRRGPRTAWAIEHDGTSRNTTVHYGLSRDTAVHSEP